MYSSIVPMANAFSATDTYEAKFARRNGAVPLIDVPPTDVPWLWPGRIPRGRVTLLASDPAMGKSLLALDIAARVSTGRHWPDEVRPPSRGGEEMASDDAPTSTARLAAPTVPSPNPQSEIPNPQSPLPPSSVLLLIAEDNIADTVRPRLEALGADCSRIVALTHVRNEIEDEPARPFAFHRDLSHLRELLYGMNDCRLVVIDPVTAFLGTASEQSNADVWNLLASLDRLARDHHLAILMVSHFRRRNGAAMFRTLGSLAFIAATRAAWTIVQDPANPNRRLFLPIKNNLSPETKGLAFTIESSPTHAPVIRWSPETIETTAEAALAQRPRRRPDGDADLAATWLQELLASGPLPSRDIFTAAAANGITPHTLRRAYHKLGTKAYQPKGVHHGPWFWRLPGSLPEPPNENSRATDKVIEKPQEFKAQ
jgi:hypothetical protein